ncbi:serine/threonine-protein kinase [Enhygromyxa salina]|uniref:Serine/threonine-protein kinase pkn6 n=1 Tax=Enhygromyxa salina TaxID=215803 RepID=A0A2S9YWD3_9BACT|nr:serine/threonine-protein kinase [Enhygromyxa salina]PRQ09393.1 Serine/threonine-protein kinase pkn6 [Enhygromyxa salina]
MLEPDTQVIPPRDAVPPRDGRGPSAPQPRAPSRSEVEPGFSQRWVGRYELIHRLAHGGMATVYLGRAKGKAGFEKIVAVKVIHPHLAAEAEFVGMFLDEARIAARIHHPHVVEILDLGQSDSVYYMVMEFIEGENLAALVRALKGELLPIPVALQIVADTLAGLGAAHEVEDVDGRPYELVHRDVSPHNILINLDGWAKVGDFGIMKAAGKASNTRTGELRGKLAYMSPEQARGNGHVDHRTDLFAVGVIIWELLTGERLFACPSEAATLEKVIACVIPPLGDARPELDGHPGLRDALEALLARALATDPDQRHANASEMLAEVKLLLRLAYELPGDEPRSYLGQLMRRFFLRRVDYARAALRRTGEHDALSSGARELIGETAAMLGRPPTGSNPVTPPFAELALTPTGAAALDSSGTERPSTDSHPQFDTAAGSGRTHPLAQWSMWLLLPMLGAGIAVAAMLMLGGSPQPPVAAPAEHPESTPEPTPEPAARPAPSSLAAANYAPLPQKPAGMIRWYFSTKPEGAQVWIDGEDRGLTPVSVFVPIGEAPVDIRLLLDGYEPYPLELPPTNDQSFSTKLQALAPDAEPTGKSGKSTKAIKRPRQSGKGASTGGSDDGGETGSDPVKKGFVPVPDSLRESGG